MAADMIAVRGRVEGEADRKILSENLFVPGKEKSAGGQAALDRNPDPIQKASWLAELTGPPPGSPPFKGENLEALGQIFKARRTETIGKELLGLARELEPEAPGLATTLYNFLQNKTEFSKYAPQGRHRLEVMQGGGSGADQAAAFGRNFLHTFCDIPGALTMVAGGFGFRLARPAFGSLFSPLFNITGKLSSRQKLARRLFANTGAWGTEAATFATAGKLTRAAFGQEVDWSKESWLSDGLHGGILMGNIRAAFWAGGLAGKAFQAAGWFGRRSAWALQNLSLYTGIRLSQFEERLAGLSKQNPLVDEDWEALQHFAFFKGAGLLVRHFTPRPIQRWEQKLDLDGELTLESLATALPKVDWKNALQNFTKKLLTQHSPLMTQARHPLIGSNVGGQTVAMAIGKGQPRDESVIVSWDHLLKHGNASSPPKKVAREETTFEDTTLPDFHPQRDTLPPEVKARFRILIDRLPTTTQKAIKLIEECYQQSKPQLGDHELKSLIHVADFQDPAKLDFALRRLAHMVTHNDAQGTQGTYAGWITRLAFRRIIEDGNAMKLRQLVDLHNEGAPIKIYEIFLAPDLAIPELLPMPRSLFSKFTEPIKMIATGIHRLALSEKAEIVLRRYYHTERKFMSQTSTLSAAEVEIKAKKLLENVIVKIQGAQVDPVLREGVERALELAGDSSLAMLRLNRLFRILGEEEVLTHTKLHELGDPNLQIHGNRPPLLPPHPVQIVGTQWDAYLGKGFDPRTLPSVFTADPKTLKPWELELRNRTKLLHILHQGADDLLNPVKAKVRAYSRRSALEKYLKGINGKDPYTPEGVEGGFRALAELGDKVSLQIANRIKDKKIELEFHEEEAYYRKLENHSENKDQISAEDHKKRRVFHGGAFYIPRLSRGNPLGIIVIETPAFRLPDPFFDVLWRISHEEQHDRDFTSGDRRYCREHHRYETSAKAKDVLFKAIHGDTEPLEDFLSTAPEGLGLRFRDFFEDGFGFYFKKTREKKPNQGSLI